MTWEEIKLEISAEVKKRMEERHISEDEAKQVIYNAESTGEKLYQSDNDKQLAKLRIGNATFYIEYSKGKSSYTIRTAYAHKSEITG